MNIKFFTVLHRLVQEMLAGKASQGTVYVVPTTPAELPSWEFTLTSCARAQEVFRLDDPADVFRLGLNVGQPENWLYWQPSVWEAVEDRLYEVLDSIR